ncbi:protein kinase domain-containing protein [Colletotrichum kahawae]|uniref:non-specific serine/threonine protein kinase n=1 Tax=Colletotrichum kahawae TaxID=34407 RepID=A0AAD9YN98_COLKA|nr:protein kinase domain-containing protein [Colletotrichum kahawae]
MADNSSCSTTAAIDTSTDSSCLDRTKAKSQSESRHSNIDFTFGETWTQDDLDELDILVWNDDEPEEFYANYYEGGLHPVRIGDQLANGRYTIFHKLGRGSFSTVWLARDEKRNCNVAIKITGAQFTKSSKEADVLKFISSSEIPKAGREYLQIFLHHFDHQGPNGTHSCPVSKPASFTVAQGLLRMQKKRVLPVEVARAIAAQIIIDLHPGNIILAHPDQTFTTQTIEEIYRSYDRPAKIPLHLYQAATLRKPPIPDNAPPYIVAGLYVAGGFDAVELSDAEVMIGDFSESWKPSQETKHELKTWPPSRAPESLFGKRLNITMDRPSDIWSLGCLIYRVFGVRVILDTVHYDPEVNFTRTVGMIGKPPKQWWDLSKKKDGLDSNEGDNDVTDDDSDENENETIDNETKASLRRRVKQILVVSTVASVSAKILATPDKVTAMIPMAKADSEVAAIELAAANRTWALDELDEADAKLFDAPEECLGDYEQGGFHPVQLGDRLDNGRYIVFHKLGHGGFSTVWLAHDEKLGRNVAIKILKADVAECTNDGNNFGPSMSDTHIHIQNDSFWHDGPNGSHLCFVSSPVRTTVAQSQVEYQRSRSFPLETARAIVAQVIQGLASLHALGIVHGDLHPGNIFLKFRDAEIADRKVSDIYATYGTPEKVPIRKYQTAVLDGTPPAPESPPYIVRSIITNSGCDTIALDRAKITVGDFGESWNPGMTTRYELGTPAFYRAPESRNAKEKNGPLGFPSDV